MSYLNEYRIPPDYTDIKDDFASKLAGIAYPSTICLATAVILNCKNWYYYYSKIGVMAYRADPYDKEKQMMFAGHRKNMMYINFVTIFAVIVNIAILVTVCELSFSGRRDMNSARFFEMFTLVLFGLLSIAFAITSFMLIRRLRRFYPDFFQQHRCLLYLASAGLTIPLAGRCAYDAFKLNEQNVRWLEDYEFIVNLMVWLLFDLVPTAF